MPKVRPSIWFATFCVCVGVLIIFRHCEKQIANAPVAFPRPIRHETFHRVPPTSPAPPTVAGLVSELNDPSPSVRERAAVELGNTGIDALEAVPDLKRLAANDPDEKVRRASRFALYNVRGGQPSPPDFFSPTPAP